MRSVLLILLVFISAHPNCIADDAPVKAEQLFDRENLIAWCIVPFDAKHRTPTERAQMLRRLGFTKFAYDWRQEHVPTFDDEIAAMRKENIEIVAWWFPPALNDDARAILAALKRNGVKTQLWVALDDPDPNARDDTTKVQAAVKALRPIAEAAAAQGCSIGLYNHGGWFGEPEHQLAIIEAMNMPNVGMVYNLHHGHSDFDRLPTLLPRMKPHLYAVNINGSDRDGGQFGRKILPLGQGELDLELLRSIQTSGYKGPIGILGHTQDDAEERLQDNLDGLQWLIEQLEGEPAGERPTPRTPVPPRPTNVVK